MAGDILSQSEIDKLLSAISTGVVSADEVRVEEQKKIKVYDFKRPDKFSKDQIRTLFMLHENFARILNTYLSTHLRVLVKVEVVSVDQLTYEEFIRSLPNPSVISILSLSSLKGNIIFEMDTNVVFSIIDRLFGGMGDESKMKARTLTDIEETVIKNMMSKMMEGLQEAWHNVQDFKLNIESMESNPQFTQIVPSGDMVVIITLQLKVGSVEGLINICIPYIVIEPIVPKLTTTFWVSASSTRKEHPEEVDQLKKKLRKAIIPVSVELGRVSLTISEFLTLGMGDTLRLNTKADDELVCIVGERPKFYCRPGIIGKRSAVQITKVIESDDEEGEKRDG
ncbi:flagellar motor switch protein FliM [Pectinatus cerevisiiphilus]|uniref:Flagellar motor switch protein FliM n=1 Tax=Pectinatus cerevisiiphilus TaxID=86956 RepID=A0A4R3KD53_9FIRM|nr:flagellar motor switch protein FliM [Pectinatus cerevisiiphilus]TCS80953.1 flagellar motor switch protein FliM [Pectinatus cerevisiiphilus]